jgi:hypothetical protein
MAPRSTRLHWRNDAVLTRGNEVGRERTIGFLVREQHDMGARHEQRTVADLEADDRHIRRDYNFLFAVLVFDGDRATIADDEIAYSAVRHRAVLTEVPRPMSVAAAAHAGREDVDFERLQRAVRLRNGGRADIAVRFDIRYVRERDAADRRVAGELDVDVLAVSRMNLERVAGEGRNRAAHAGRRALGKCSPGCEKGAGDKRRRHDGSHESA